jgi:Uma2 family endonuclease
MERLHTFDELLAELGDVPPTRIVLRPAPGHATEAALLRRVERLGRPCELIERTLVDKPVGAREAGLQMWLGFHLQLYLTSHDRGCLFGSDGPFRLWPGLVRLPDLTFVSWEKLPGRVYPNTPIAGVVPDLAIEVLSPSNTRSEMERKRREYFQAGVPEVWEVDPSLHCVRVYLANGTPTTYTETDTLSTTILPGFALSVATLYSRVERT